MKIQCDVCEKKEAKVYCGADEAAVCEGCDHRVHHANKLASKHQRFSLLHPSFQDAPLCDICQEKRAFMFCREDRAILCRECDISVHKTNEHTQNHRRFLLTGVRISASSAPYNTNNSSQSNYKINNNNNSCDSNDYNISNNNSSSTSYGHVNEDGSISTSNVMSECLPGWRLEDLIHSSNDHNFKSFGYTNEVNWNQQVEEESMGSYHSYGSTQDYSKMWDFHQHQQPPLVPNHFPPIFLDKF